MEIYFVFFFPPQKKKKETPPALHTLASPTSQRSNQSFAKECNFADPLGTNNRNSTFYIVKRDKKYIFGDSILKSMNRIKEVLEEKGIKQKWLAEKLGKSYNMVNGYVQNRQQPKLEILFEIAEILGVNPKDLIKETK
jgi:ribosome-binding protein aMBF1 (putative translation factor)